MQFSYSRVSCFKHCPYQFKLRYIEGLKTLHDPEANNALICGNAVHLGIEKTVEEALEFYNSQFYIINDLHIEEAIKIEYLVPKVKQLLETVNIYSQERLILTKRFKGIVDLITMNQDGTVDVIDFKYSNNVDNYSESAQLHIYKYFLEQQGFKVNKLGFIFVPKVNIRRKKNESTFEFRKRMMMELNKSEIQIKEIKYDPNKVISFLSDITDVLTTKEYPKNITRLCDWCEYKKYCLEGESYMLLPSAKRRENSKVNKKKIWLYGPSFSGKTTMLDDAPNPLNLNTDGNIEFVTMPYMAIKDEVTVTGRITNRKLAWEVFKDVLTELEKNQSEFKTIIIDLLEDTREMCRIYKYNELGIQHESDSGFGKGWDIIKTEYLSTMRRFFNLDYENLVVISHEDVSKDITKKNGQNITRIAPNIQDAIATKIAGMVDIVGRVVVEDDETRTINFKTNEVVFGGGRLKGIKTTSIPLKWDALMGVYDEYNENKKEHESEEPKAPDDKKDEVSNEQQEIKEEVIKEDKPKRTRRSKKTE